MFSFKQLSEKFLQYLNQYDYKKQPAELYDPVKYIMSIGGKRIRPLMCLAGYNLYKENVEQAFNAAMAIEVFHNFSLVHDDLMDAADKRRGLPSVHKKYNDNTAILSGDAMLIMSYQLLEMYPDNYLELTQLFSKTAIEVCEGQRMDMDFETQVQPEIDAYIQMIALKTSVLIACSLKMGALIGGASESEANHLYEFGKNMGIAFQIQDDLLDTFGDEEKVGKKIGGDILQKKKTYLYLKSLELLSMDESETLRVLYSDSTEKTGDELVDQVVQLFKISHVDVHAQELKLVYQQLAFSHLKALQLDEERKVPLMNFAKELLDRTH